MNEITSHIGDPIIPPLLVVGFAFHRRKLFARAGDRLRIDESETEQVSFRKYPETPTQLLALYGAVSLYFKRHENHTVVSVDSLSVIIGTVKPRVGLCNTSCSCLLARKKSETARIRMNQPTIIKT
jgi:hypothetical protein